MIFPRCGKMGQKSSTVWKKWTAWKLSLQKTGTADDAKVQTVAGGGDPGVLWFSVAGGGDPGTGLNEPGYKNSQQLKQPTTRLATPPRNAWQAARWRGKPHGRRGSRPSRRRKQPQGCWPPVFGSGFLEGRVTPRPRGLPRIARQAWRWSPGFFSVMDGVEAVPPEGKTAHSPDGSGAACPPYEGASPPQQPPGGNRGMSDRARHGMRRLAQTKRAAARPLLCFILLKGLLAQPATHDHRQRAQAQQAHRRRLRNRNLLVGLSARSCHWITL